MSPMLHRRLISGARTILAGVCGAFAGAMVTAAAAQTREPPTGSPDPALLARQAAFWREAAIPDVQAAYALLKQNHPAAAPELKDDAFKQALERAHATAAARAKEVSTYEGYVTTLAAFANALGDKHIWSRPAYLVGQPQWAGVLVSKRGSRWVVADEDVQDSDAPLLGAELVGCDGRSAEEWGRQTLGGFRVDWSVEAQQVQAAPWLLVSEGNPFAPRPKVCRFRKDGAERTVTLNWRAIRRDRVTPRITRAVGAGAAGYGVRKVGDGYWIALQSLTDEAPPVIAQVQAQSAAMRQARFVVLDMRGNGGGSSLFGHQIAEALFGPAHVQSVLAGAGEGCGAVWRASDANIAQLQYYVDVMGPTHGAEFTQVVTQSLKEAKAARAAARAFSGPIACPDAAKPARSAVGAAPPSLMKGRLILLTDNLCFSSCLEVTDEFRALKALHVGQTTDADTRYSEVREAVLPSGLSKFSTLQAVSIGSPARVGPFVPEIAYEGDIADTAALERWVQRLPLGLSPEMPR